MVEVSQHLKGRSFTRITDWSHDDLKGLLDLADELKALQRRGEEHSLLPGRTVGLFFELHSTRTRISFAVAAEQLGASAIPVQRDESHLRRGESIRDTAATLSRYLDCIVFRTLRQEDVEDLAANASIPVVNGLTEVTNPCQALADLMTIRERLGRLSGVRIAYFGDGNNVCASLMTAAAKLGMRFVAAIPEGYDPDDSVVKTARRAAVQSGGTVELVRDPHEAAKGAEVLYTDVWTSMGQDEEREPRLADLAGFGIDSELVALGTADAIVLHCLPAHYGEEITEDVLYGPQSAVWDEAENRLHSQKALLALIIP